jgi:hypothetical protein
MYAPRSQTLCRRRANAILAIDNERDFSTLVHGFLSFDHKVVRF